MAVKEGEGSIFSMEAKRLRKEIKQLQRLLGKQALQIDLLKEAVAIGQEKKLISRHTLLNLEDIADD